MASMAPKAPEAPQAPDAADTTTDPYLWLEDVTGEEALDWVRARNEPTKAQFCGGESEDEFERMRTEALEVLDTDARIPYVRRRGDYLYDFWRDANNPRGLWRRTTLESYRTDAPEWDVLIDVDELGRTDNKKWVWAGADVIEPEFTRALIRLSPGGSDAVIVREFDMVTREFVADGFELPEAKSQVGWDDPDTILVGTDFGPDSMTESGYPRIVKRWRRGTPLSDAEMIFQGAHTDVSAGGSTDRTPGFERTFVSRSLDFWNRQRYELRGTELIPLDVPTDASSMSVHREWLLIELRTDWSPKAGADDAAKTYRAGSLLAANYDDFLSGTSDLHVVFEPDEHTCLYHYAWVRDRLLMVSLADVASQVEIVTPGSWRREPIAGIPASTNNRDRRRRRHRRRVLPGLQRLRCTVAAAARHRRFRDDAAGADQVRTHLLRRPKHLGITAFRDIRRRNVDPVLPGAPHRLRWTRPDFALRLRGLRDIQYPGLQRRDGPAMAGPRRHLRPGQYPRRR